MAGKITASLMCADIFNLEDDIRKLEKMNIDYLHLDVMDGHYVKNVTLGIELVNKLSDMTKIPRDIHLLVSNPLEFAKMINLYPNDITSFHYDAAKDIWEIIKYIKSTGAKVGIVLNTDIPIDVLESYLNDIDMVNLMMIPPGFAGQPIKNGMIEKIADLKNYLEKHNACKILIEVDGNVSFDNAIKMYKAGADIFVAGSSSIFRKDSSMEDNINKLYECIGRLALSKSPSNEYVVIENLHPNNIKEDYNDAGKMQDFLEANIEIALKRPDLREDLLAYLIMVVEKETEILREIAATRPV